MDGDREPAGGASSGDDKPQPKRVTITDNTQAGHMLGFFPRLPTGTTAAAVAPPPGPKAAAKTQSEYHNRRREAYDATAPVLVQMVPEIGEQAADSELTGRFRGVLAMARGMVTGSRANASTSGTSIWASLLSQSNTSSPAAKRASRAWGRMTEDEDMACLFHDPAAQAAGPPRHDPAAIEFKVSTTTLNRLLVWAWAMAGTTKPDEETQANTTARVQFRLLAHRVKAFTDRYADILTQTAENAATPNSMPPPAAAGTPAYVGPPAALQKMMEQHRSPPQPAALTQSQEQNSQGTTTATDTLGSSWAYFSERPSDGGGTDTGAGATDAQPSPTTGHTNASNDSANQGGGNGRLSPNATRAAHDDAEREAETKQRRIAATPEGHLSLRMCPRYGAMMGATSVSRDEIAKTTREYDPTFEGIDSDDPSSMLYATQLLTRIELTAAGHSLTMKECEGIAKKHGPQHKRAEAAGKLIHTVNQWAAADGAELPGERKRLPPMPTLLGGTAAPTATGRPWRHDEDDTPDDDAAPAGHAMTEEEHRMAREQREQEAADWQSRVDTRERQIEEHALELQRQLQDQQLTRHKQQQERQQQQDETDALEQQRQRLIKQRQDLEKQQQDFSRDFQQQLLHQQTAQQHPPAQPARATTVPQGGQLYPQQYTAQSLPSAFTTQHQTHTPHYSQAAPPPPGPPPQPWGLSAAATPHASQGGPAFGVPPPTATPLPIRVDALLTGTATHEWAPTLLTMAGAVPGSTIQIDLLRLMSTEDVSYIVEGFLTKAGQTADSCRPPAGVKAFQHFWNIASKYTSEREERKDSVSAQNHADKSAGKLLEKSTSEAAHAPTHTASASVYSDPATIAALKQFAGTKKIANVDAVLATVPAPARAILMAKFDTDNGTVLTADGQEAKRGALFLVTEVLPRRAQRVLRTNPHCPEMSFTDRENTSKHVTQALFATKAAIWTFVQTPRGMKPLKSWDDWIQHANNTPVTWAEDTANAIDLFVSVVTATHGYGAQATGPADADATKDDDDDKSKSLLIGTTHNQMITYEMNWSWLEPWMGAFSVVLESAATRTVFLCPEEEGTVRGRQTRGRFL